MCLCSPHLYDILGFQKSFHFTWLQISFLIILISSLFCSILASISLLTVLISSFFCWILVLFSISFSAVLSIVLYHISGVSSFDFAPEGAGWLHHWTEFQFNLNLCLGHLVPILCPCHLGHLITRGIMFPLFLASFSSTSSFDHVIRSYNISDLSLMDGYRDSLNHDSWGSSLVLGMIMWLIIRSCFILGI